MSPQFDHGYALLIGVDENAVPDYALPDVRKDIDALYAVLTHSERCAYPPEQVKRITGSAATRDGITAGLAWLHEKIAADTSGNATAVIFYSGHGWRTSNEADATFYLIPYNVARSGLAAAALRSSDFAATINEMQPQRLLVVLDCCHAAGMGVKEVAPVASGYQAMAAPPTLFGEDKGLTPATAGAKGLENLQSGAGRAVLSSSQGDQRSYVRKDRAMSIFTYHLIEALTGHAQPAEGAGEVLVSDIVSYVHRRVPASAQADWQKAQTPDYQISGNFPVALLLGGKGLSKDLPAPDPLQTLPAPSGPSAVNRGSGALAQGPGAVAAGERGVAVGGDLRDSTVVTGDRSHVTQVNTGGGQYIRGSVNTGGGDFIGRNRIVQGDEVHGDKVAGDKITVGNLTGNQGVAIGRHARSTTTVITGDRAAANLDRLFAPLLALAQVAPPEQRQGALAMVQTLKAEAERGAQADDRRLARAIEQLVALLPSTTALLSFTFGQPPLAPVIGPATAYVLEKLAE